MKTVSTEDAAKVVEGIIWIDPERQGGDPLEEFLEGFPPVTREQAEKVLELAKNNFVNTWC